MGTKLFDRDRRRILRDGLIGAATLLGASAVAANARGATATSPETAIAPSPTAGSGVTSSAPVRVITPDVPKLRWRMVNGIKVFRLVAQAVKREFLPGWTFDVWGYNGLAPGPAIEAVEGDRVRIIVENRLPEPTSMHWHGLEVPDDMDGAPGVQQTPIAPGGRFIYEFELHQNGTFFYHSHMPMQEMMGMLGLFIIHPRRAHSPHVDRDFGLVVQEFAVLPNNTIPNSMSMEFNWTTLNGRVGPATTPLLVKLGERVRIRFVNLGMDHHPMHLHGNTFWVTGTEGGRIPKSAWIPGNTVLLGVAQARDVEFDAQNEGNWMLHCHLPHHNMNHMVSMVGPMASAGTQMAAGLSMRAGMGMVGGAATASANGPSIGRGMGLGATAENPVANMSHHGSMHQSMKLVPGFPQDMFEPMDADVAKPATYGLRPGWSGGVMGMMTLVRVVKPELFNKITAMEAARSRAKS